MDPGGIGCYRKFRTVWCAPQHAYGFASASGSISSDAPHERSTDKTRTSKCVRRRVAVPEYPNDQAKTGDSIYRRRFEGEMMELCVRCYITYQLSYRDLGQSGGLGG
jgi:hypothetical protein